MKEFKEMSETEMEIMEVLWSSGIAKTPTEILEYFNVNKSRNWKRQTISTFLMRLSEKGMLSSKKEGRTVYYTPAITQKEYDRNKAKGILDTLYEGSVKNFMTALYDADGVSDKEIDDLKKWLNNK